VEDNILLNDSNEQNSVEEAARSACADEFITSMEKGYKTDVSRLGNNLSVGQKQRIALSRFFYKGADLLILDEPTSAIDNQSAISIREAIKNVPTGKTIIVVTHNPLIAKFAERVIIIDNGEIIKDGGPGLIIEEKNYILTNKKET
jgi:ABC-type bacteriocin/lantibiotic exporter with double-glycine peptidase domain